MLAAYIEASAQLLDLRLTKEPNQGVACVDLAWALRMRLNLGGDIALLDSIIDIEQEGLELIPADHSLRAIACLNFVKSVVDRYNRSGTSMLMEKAAEAAREALGLHTIGHLN